MTMPESDLPRTLAAEGMSRMRRLDPIDSAQTLALIAEAGYGRIVFTHRALPAIRPVNHLVESGEIVIRTHAQGPLAQTVAASKVVVAYQADRIDPQARLGWSAVITGYARTVTDPAEVARLSAALIPWLDKTNDIVIRIRPEIINGYRLVEPS